MILALRERDGHADEHYDIEFGLQHQEFDALQGEFQLREAVLQVSSKATAAADRPGSDRVPAQDVAGLRRATVKAFFTATDASVETDDGASLVARQAASCLLAPVIGDRVLLHVEAGDAYILAVLARSTNHAAEISVPGAARIIVSAGERLELTAPAVAVSAGRLELVSKVLVAAGDVLTSNFRRITETVVDKMIGARTITTSAQTRTAVVKDVDLLSAGTLVQNVDSIATQKSEIALITAKRDVRLDAERVSVG